MMNSKGITPIIAIILLLMMTVAVAGAAFFWLSRIQNQLQGGVESYQSTIFTSMSSRIDVLTVDYNDTHSNLTIIFQNTGNTKIPISDDTDAPTTTWILKDYTQTMRCTGNWTSASNAQCQKGCGHDPPPYIDVGATYPVILHLTGDCAIDLADDGGKMFYFTIDLSGRTTASSQFIAQ